MRLERGDLTLCLSRQAFPAFLLACWTFLELTASSKTEENGGSASAWRLCGVGCVHIGWRVVGQLRASVQDWWITWFGQTCGRLVLLCGNSLTLLLTIIFWLAANLTADEAFENITAELIARYPKHIKPTSGFVFINAGGFMGSFKLIHASLSEYILFFGSPIGTLAQFLVIWFNFLRILHHTGTTGHSGRYWGDIYDFLLTGEFWQWNEGDTKFVVHHPGAKIIHEKWAATGIKIKEGSWMLGSANILLHSHVLAQHTHTHTHSLTHSHH